MSHTARGILPIQEHVNHEMAYPKLLPGAVGESVFQRNENKRQVKRKLLVD